MASFGSVQKTGKNSWKLTISGGFDDAGKRRRFTKTIRVINDDEEKQKKEAEKQLALFQRDIERGEFANVGKMNLKQFFEYYENNYALDRHEKKTIFYNRNLFKRIDIALGHLRLDKISPANLLKFYKNLKEPGIRSDGKQGTLSPNTIKKYHTLLHSLLSKAVQWQFIAYNPADKVEPPKAQKTHKQIYDEEQIGKFLYHLQNEELKYRALCLLALSTGMRRGELLGLKWKHIDFQNGIIDVLENNQYLPGEGIYTKQPKTEGGIRKITFSDSVGALLKQFKAEQAARQLSLGDKWQNCDRIFTTWDGKPMHPDTFLTWLTKFTKKHNLPPISPHSFRHMNATYLITSGIDLRTVGGKLGHHPATTQTVYSHLLKSAERKTTDKMEEFIQGVTEKAKKAQKKQAN